MAETTGLECKFYLGSDYDDDFTTDIANWVVLAKIIDVNIAEERTEVMAPTRDSEFDKSLVALKKVAFEVKLLRDNSDTQQQALATAYEAGSDVICIAADGLLTVVGTIGVKMQGVITKFSAGEPLEGAATIDMTIKPSAKSSNNPVGVEVEAP